MVCRSKGIQVYFMCENHISSPTVNTTHLHAEAGFGPSERQNFNLHLLTFGDHVGHVSDPSFFPQL